MNAVAPQLRDLRPGVRLARTIVSDMSALVSPPDVCLKLAEMVGDERTSIESFAAVIVRDPSLTARVLKVVNSPYYGLASKIDTISRAVMILGTKDLANLVFSLSAVTKFSKISSRVTNMNTFWRHAVYTGLTAEVLAHRANVLHPERLFVAGLLHDIGTLLINQRFPELAEASVQGAYGNELLLYQTEQEWLELDHANMGAILMEHWHLPEATCDAIRWHHEPQQAEVAPLEAALVHVADILANLSGVGSYSEQITEQADFDPQALAIAGLTKDFDRDAVLDEIDRKFVETIYLLVG